MAMTRIKQLYVEGRQKGMTQADAAVYAGCTERSANVRGAQLEKDFDVMIAMGNAQMPDDEPTSEQPPTDPTLDPVEFFRRMMNDVSLDPKVRLEAARSLAAYTVMKPGTKVKVTKKEERKEAAAMVGKFASASAPALPARPN